MVKFTSAAIAAALIGVSSLHGVDAFAGLAKSKSNGSSLKMVSYMLLVVEIFLGTASSRWHVVWYLARRFLVESVPEA
jgi:hypothetical protein